MTHRTGIGHIPAAGAVSWGCTCGAADVLTYARSTPAWLAAALMGDRADNHRLAAEIDQLADDHRKET